MESKKIFKKYYSELAKEGKIKALICGFIVGFSLSLISASIAFMVNNFNLSGTAGIWISVVIGLAVAVLCTPVFYYAMFRPTTKKMAERIDRLGMDERCITMLQLEKDESYIAARQREDTKERLKSVNRKRLKLSFFIVPIAVLALLAVGSVTMVTMSAEGFDEKLPWYASGDGGGSGSGEGPGPGIEEPYEDDAVCEYFEIIYMVYGAGGSIEGDTHQVVVKGEDATLVVAVPDDGWFFHKWMDDIEDPPVLPPERIETNVQYSMFFLAQFRRPREDEDGETPSPIPPPEPIEGDDGEANPNLIIDGTTYYREEGLFEIYYNKAMAILSSGGELPVGLKLFIQKYFEAIK